MLKIIILSIALMALLASSPSIASKSNACQSDTCKKTFSQFKRAAREGKPQALATLAELYFHGYGTGQNLEKALKYYLKAAKKGVPRAQYKVGLMYLQAPFKDSDKGLKYLEKAAKTDYKHANYTLGMIYYSDQFGQKNNVKADEHLALAYADNHFAMPEFIEHIQAKESINSQNFPLLFEQMLNDPLVSDNNGKLTWLTDDTEVITVLGPSIEEQLGDQLVVLRYKNKSTGSRLSGATCAESIGCIGTNAYDLYNNAFPPGFFNIVGGTSGMGSSVQ